MSSTNISSLYTQNDDDDDDDGRRSGICIHSTCIDEMFIFTSSKCKYFVYTYSHCIKGEKIGLTGIRQERKRVCIFKQYINIHRLQKGIQRSSCQGLFFLQQKHPLELIRRRLVFLVTVYDVNPSTIQPPVMINSVHIQ